MGDKTGISWTDATWSPLTGCSRVSAGCDACYAADLASGRLKNVPAYQGLAERVTGADGKSRGVFNGTVRLLPDRLDQPLRWKRPRRVFVNSMSDVFHPAVDVDTIAKLYAIMVVAQDHTFQVLTKRPERARIVLVSDEFRECYEDEVTTLLTTGGYHVEETPARPGQHRDEGWWREDDGWPHTILHAPHPAPNVHLGTSIEDQRYAFRARHLLRTPAAVRFISAEPLIGPLDLSTYLHGQGEQGGIDWVIVGGESGRNARPMAAQWADDLRQQCTGRAAFWFKQAGRILGAEWGCDDTHGADQTQWPARLQNAQAFPVAAPAAS